MSEPSADVLALTGSDQAYRWNLAAPVGTSIVVTYSFSKENPSYDANARPGFVAFTEAHKVHARAALDVWAQQSGIAFVEVPASVGGELRFAMYDMSGVLNSVGNQASGFAYYPQYGSIGGDIYLNANFYAAAASALAPGVRGFSIMLHELGHAIGFKHSFEGTPTINPSHDNGNYTVMSYSRPDSTTTLGSVDIDAARYYYGTDDFTYHWSPTTRKLTLTGTGNADWMHGTELSDRLNGLGGRDVLYGWLGNDTYIVAQAGDVVKEVWNAGTDIVRASISYTLSTNVETLVLTGTSVSGAGNSLSNNLTGNNSANTLSGRGNNDALTGDGGNDTLIGGAGNDTLTGSAGNDLLIGEIGQDMFDFNSMIIETTNVDRISDFNPFADQIRLDDDVFTTLSSGSLDAAAFLSGAGATNAGDADDRIIYNTTNGNLYYDVDGVEGAAPRQFAKLVGAPAGVSEADFFIVA